MDFVCSLTGKSPSTTGAGSEGALTKAPFNALCPVIDLNNALVSFILTGYHGFTTPAGYIGHKYRVDHDLSLLIPELWARMQPFEKIPGKNDWRTASLKRYRTLNSKENSFLHQYSATELPRSL